MKTFESVNPTAELTHHDLHPGPQTPCVHCGNFVFVVQDPARAFCCKGCETVHDLLRSKGLTHYYELKRNAPGAQPVQSSSNSYRYLDDPDLLDAYGVHPDRPELQFFLEGIHCVACLWLLEKLPDFVPGVIRSTLDMGRSVITVRTEPGVLFSQVASMLDLLGYRPHAMRLDESSENLLKKENRAWLLRTGTAGAITGNIMLLAFALYAGANGATATSFRWLSLVLFLPIPLYAATPFYQSAWRALRNRQLSIDVPIALAIVLGSVVSAINTTMGSEHVYFDSLSALVFLLLSSRYVLRRLQQKSLSTASLLTFLTPMRASKLIEGVRFEEMSIESVRRGDVIRVDRGEVIPTDGKIRSGNSTLNLMVLTGEAMPARVTVGDFVFAGTINESEPLEVVVSAKGRDTRIGEILRQIEDGQIRKSSIVSAADRRSRWFLLAVFVLSAVAFLLGHTTTDSFQRALAMIIVTCPCALALATPLTMAVSLKRAAKHGIFVKSADILEKLTTISTVFLDKTGTLTFGNYDVLESRLTPELDSTEVALIVRAIETSSPHPVGRALLRWAEKSITRPAFPKLANSISTVPGLGVSGKVDDRNYQILRLEESQWISPELSITNPHHTLVALFDENRKIAEFALGDRIRYDSKAAIRMLRSLKLEPRLLSGDRKIAVQGIAQLLEIDPAQTFAALSPEEKRQMIDQNPGSLVIGDGANDAIALAAADVGVAVHGSMEASLRAADVYFSRPGVFPLIRLIRLSRETMRVIHRNFAFSLAYNAAAAAAALLGQITPLSAAVLMPLSALTVFVSSVWRASDQDYEKFFHEEILL